MCEGCCLQSMRLVCRTALVCVAAGLSAHPQRPDNRDAKTHRTTLCAHNLVPTHRFLHVCCAVCCVFRLMIQRRRPARVSCACLLSPPHYAQTQVTVACLAAYLVHWFERQQRLRFKSRLPPAVAAMQGHLYGLPAGLVVAQVRVLWFVVFGGGGRKLQADTAPG